MSHSWFVPLHEGCGRSAELLEVAADPAGGDLLTQAAATMLVYSA